MNPALIPIRWLGLALAFFSLFSLPLFLGMFLDYSSFPVIQLIVIGALIFNLLTGVGLFYTTKWGYILFKIWLYLALAGFPIGTFFAWKLLSYMKRHQLKQYFGLRHIRL